MTLVSASGLMYSHACGLRVRDKFASELTQPCINSHCKPVLSSWNMPKFGCFQLPATQQELTWRDTEGDVTLWARPWSSSSFQHDTGWLGMFFVFVSEPFRLFPKFNLWLSSSDTRGHIRTLKRSTPNESQCNAIKVELDKAKIYVRTITAKYSHRRCLFDPSTSAPMRRWKLKLRS